MLLKKLSKRDTTTKLKALAELRAKLKERGAEWAAEFLPHWTLCFGRLATDISWQVRDQTCGALTALAGLVGRQLATRLKQLITPWLCCKCDPQHDVRRSADAAFAAAFPNATKFGEVLLFCREELVRSLAERALAPPPAKSADKDEAAEAAEEHERCVGTALRAIAALLDGVPAKAAATQLEPLLEPHLPSLWPLGGAKAPSVRAALFALCLALLKAVPELAERELGGLGGVLLDGLSEKDPICHAALWEPLLLLLRGHGERLRAATPSHKHILARLSSLLRHGCYGGATSACHALLPLASLLPDGQLVPAPAPAGAAPTADGVGVAAAAALLPALWDGLSSEQLGASQIGQLFGAYGELLQLLLATATRGNTTDATTGAAAAATTGAAAAATAATVAARQAALLDHGAGAPIRHLLRGTLPPRLSEASACSRLAAVLARLASSAKCAAALQQWWPSLRSLLETAERAAALDEGVGGGDASRTAAAVRVRARAQRLLCALRTELLGAVARAPATATACHAALLPQAARLWCRWLDGWLDGARRGGGDSDDDEGTVLLGLARPFGLGSLWAQRFRPSATAAVAADEEAAGAVVCVQPAVADGTRVAISVHLGLTTAAAAEATAATTLFDEVLLPRVRALLRPSTASPDPLVSAAKERTLWDLCGLLLAEQLAANDAPRLLAVGDQWRQLLGAALGDGEEGGVVWSACLGLLRCAKDAEAASDASGAGAARWRCSALDVLATRASCAALGEAWAPPAEPAATTTSTAERTAAERVALLCVEGGALGAKCVVDLTARLAAALSAPSSAPAAASVAAPSAARGLAALTLSRPALLAPPGRVARLELLAAAVGDGDGDGDGGDPPAAAAATAQLLEALFCLAGSRRGGAWRLLSDGRDVAADELAGFVAASEDEVAAWEPRDETTADAADEAAAALEAEDADAAEGVAEAEAEAEAAAEAEAEEDDAEANHLGGKAAQLWRDAAPLVWAALCSHEAECATLGEALWRLVDVPRAGFDGCAAGGGWQSGAARWASLLLQLPWLRCDAANKDAGDATEGTNYKLKKIVGTSVWAESWEAHAAGAPQRAWRTAVLACALLRRVRLASAFPAEVGDAGFNKGALRLPPLLLVELIVLHHRSQAEGALDTSDDEGDATLSRAAAAELRAVLLSRVLPYLRSLASAPAHEKKPLLSATVASAASRARVPATASAAVGAASFSTVLRCALHGTGAPGSSARVARGEALLAETAVELPEFLSGDLGANSDGAGKRLLATEVQLIYGDGTHEASEDDDAATAASPRPLARLATLAVKEVMAMRPAQAAAARAAMKRLGGGGGGEDDAAAEEAEVARKVAMLGLMLPALPQAELQPAATLEQLQKVASTLGGGDGLPPLLEALVEALGALLVRRGGWVLNDEALGHARWVAPLVEQALRAVAAGTVAATEAAAAESTKTVRGALGVLAVLSPTDAAAPRLRRLVVSWLLVHGATLASRIGAQHTLLRALAAAAALPAEELPASCGGLAPLLAAKSPAVRCHAMLLICRAAGAAAGAGAGGSSSGGGAAGASGASGGCGACAGSSSSSDEKGEDAIPEAELAEILPAGLLRLLGGSGSGSASGEEPPDEGARFLAWGAVLRLYSAMPPPLQGRLAAHWKLSQLPALLTTLVSGALPLNADPAAAASMATPRPMAELIEDACARGAAPPLAALATSAYLELLRALPSAVRHWWSHDAERGASTALARFTEAKLSPLLLRAEVDEAARRIGVDDEHFKVRGSAATRQISATYAHSEGAAMQLVLTLSACHPLRALECECVRRVGVSDAKWRKWHRSIMTLLLAQNGAISEALLLWRDSVDKVFEGVEECPICYAVVHATTRALPKLQCRTCHNKFHSACLYKWFSSSQKSTCPLCQSTF